jgi:hypothetical protein
LKSARKKCTALAWGVETKKQTYELVGIVNDEHLNVVPDVKVELIIHLHQRNVDTSPVGIQNQDVAIPKEMG